MATYKRRIVYLTDEQWAAIKERADKEGLSISSYIRLSVMATGSALHPDIEDIERQTYGRIIRPNILEEVDRVEADIVRRRFNSGMFTPVPKPAPKKKPGKRF